VGDCGWSRLGIGKNFSPLILPTGGGASALTVLAACPACERSVNIHGLRAGWWNCLPNAKQKAPNRGQGDHSQGFASQSDGYSFVFN
jgi:hypothetical protein